MSPVIPLTPASAPNADDQEFVAAIGSMLPARTVVRGSGARAGTFNDTTQPTYDQVLELRTIADDDIQTDTGDLTKVNADQDTIDRLTRQYRSLLKLRTAMLVELTYFAGEVATGRSAYDKYERIWDKRLPSFVTAVAQAGAGNQPGAVDDQLGPVYSFPAAPVDCPDGLAPLPWPQRTWTW